MLITIPYNFRDVQVQGPAQYWAPFIQDDFEAILDAINDGRVINVMSHGAACNSDPLGLTGADDTAAINAALAAVPSGGGVVYIPGWSKISGPLLLTKSGTTVMGSGPGSSGLVTTSATDNHFTCTSALSQVRFLSFGVWSTVTKSNGSVFHCPRAREFFFWNIGCGATSFGGSNRLWRVIDLQGAFVCAISSCQLGGSQESIVRVYADSTYNAELYIDSTSLLHNCDGIGIHQAGGFGGVYVNCGVVGCLKDVVIDQSSNASINPQFFLGPSGVLDACKDTCLEIGENGASTVNLSSGWIASAGQLATATGRMVGIYTHPTNSALTIVGAGGRVRNCVGGGAEFNGGRGALTGWNWEACGNGGAGTGYGVVLNNAAVGRYSFVGGQFDGNVQGDVNIVAGVTEYDFEGVTFTHATPVTNATTLSTARIIKDCPGYVTERNDSATISAGNTSVVVNHGLKSTPRSIRLTPKSTPGATLWWWDTPTATQFTIHLTGAAAADIVFDYFAAMNEIA